MKRCFLFIFCHLVQIREKFSLQPGVKAMLFPCLWWNTQAMRWVALDPPQINNKLLYTVYKMVQVSCYIQTTMLQQIRWT